MNVSAALVSLIGVHAAFLAILVVRNLVARFTGGTA